MGEEPKMQDLVGLQKPIEKLIETVERGIGGLARPWQIRRVARAKADAEISKAVGETKAAIIRSWGETYSEETGHDVLIRAVNRLRYIEGIRQINIESIVNKAIDRLPNEVSVSPVDNDWARMYFEECQDVSKEDLQELWAQLLAGEVSTPGKYYQRTLRVLKQMDSHHVQMFKAFKNCLLRLKENEESSATLFCVLTPECQKYLYNKGLGDDARGEMMSLGLAAATAPFAINDRKSWHLLGFGDASFLVKRIGITPTMFVGSPRYDATEVLTLTQVGIQLHNLRDADPDYSYLRILLDSSDAAGLEFARTDHVVILPNTSIDSLR